MEDTKKIIHICREIPALEVDKEGHLRGGFVGISPAQPRAGINDECFNKTCNNPGCWNIDCINVAGCSNGGCSNLSTGSGTTPAPTPTATSGGSFVSLSFMF